MEKLEREDPGAGAAWQALAPDHGGVVAACDRPAAQRGEHGLPARALPQGGQGAEAGARGSVVLLARQQQYRGALRAAALVVTAAALCSLAVVHLGDAGGISRSGLRALGQQRQMSMLDLDDFGDGDDDGDDGDDDGDSFGDGGLNSFSAAGDLEDSGSYVGYLAWSDAKLQRVLNNTHTQLWQMMHQWNVTYAPVRIAAMKHKLWLLKNAFSNHGYLLESAKTGMQSLRSLSQTSLHNALDEIGSLTPRLQQELAHIVNQTHRVIAREARIDARQGRRMIRAEQIDLKTDAVVRKKVREAQEMLSSLQARVHNVTTAMMHSALAFGEAAAADMHRPTVEAELHQLPSKFSVRKLAVEAVKVRMMSMPRKTSKDSAADASVAASTSTPPPPPPPSPSPPPPPPPPPLLLLPLHSSSSLLYY